MSNRQTIELVVNRKRKNYFVRDISYIEVEDKLCVIHLKSGEQLRLFSSMSEIEEKLPLLEYIRISRRYLVAYREIKAVGEDVELFNGESLPYSSRKKKELMEGYRSFVCGRQEAPNGAPLLPGGFDFSVQYQTFDSIPVAFVVAEVMMLPGGRAVDLQICYCNEAAAGLLRRPVDVLTGAYFYRDLFREAGNELLAHFTVSAFGGKKQELEYRYDANGRCFFLSCFQPYYRYCACLFTEIESGQKPYVPDEHEQAVQQDIQEEGFSKRGYHEAVSDAYSEVLELDCRKRMLYIWKNSTKPELENREISYYDYFMDYMENVIGPNDRDTFWNLFSYDRLERFLAGGQEIQTEDVHFMTKLAVFTWYEVSFRKSRVNKEHLYICARSITKRKTSEILNCAVKEEYDFIIYLEAETDTYLMYGGRDGVTPLPPPVSKFYEKEMEAYAQEYVTPSYRRQTVHNMRLAYILKQLEKRHSYEFLSEIAEKDGRNRKKLFRYTWFQKEKKIVVFTRRTWHERG